MDTIIERTGARRLTRRPMRIIDGGRISAASRAGLDACATVADVVAWLKRVLLGEAA
ncbi:MAG: hypothetical protein AB7E47_08735 [Desulfovibrionaceae bacterium]